MSTKRRNPVTDLVCVRAFGTYKPGDSAGSVPEGAAYSTEFFAPADHPAAAIAVDTRTAHLAELEAELKALESGDTE
jgi:hypothetical protein